MVVVVVVVVVVGQAGTAPPPEDDDGVIEFLLVRCSLLLFISSWFCVSIEKEVGRGGMIGEEFDGELVRTSLPLFFV